MLGEENKRVIEVKVEESKTVFSRTVKVRKDAFVRLSVVKTP